MSIAGLIFRLGISMVARPVKANPNWTDDAFQGASHFRCTFKRTMGVKARAGRVQTPGVRTMSIGYSMGSAHTQPPTAVEVLECLASDACGSDTFEDWCSDLGMDSDSRKALQTFQAIRRNTKRLETFLGMSAHAFLRQVADEAA